MSEMYEPILILRESVAKGENHRLVAVAHGCGVTVQQALSAVLKVWAWARRHANGGTAQGVPAEFIDQHTGIPGFAKALIDNRWLTVRSTGLEFPEWNKYLSSESSSHALDNARQRRCRQRKKEESPPVTERRDEQGSNPPHTPPVCSGFDFSFGGNTAIQEAWKDFHSHREQKDKKGWTQSAQLRNAKKVADIAKRRGPAAAIVAIGRSVECGWTGIFEPPKDTEHDLRLQATNDTAAWYHALPELQKKALLDDYRLACRTMSKKDQDRPGAFMRWAEEQRTQARSDDK